jgi:alpha-L-rhamnosidase
LVAMQEILLGVVPTAPSADEPSTVVTITPPASGLNHAGGSFPTPAGVFSVAWRNTGRRLSVTVPPNGRAHCVFPGATPSQLKESGRSIDRAQGIISVATSSNGVTLALGSGSYNIAITT